MTKRINIDKLKIEFWFIALIYLATSVLVNSSDYFSFSLFQKKY